METSWVGRIFTSKRPIAAKCYWLGLVNGRVVDFQIGLFFYLIDSLESDYFKYGTYLSFCKAESIKNGLKVLQKSRD